MDDALPVKKKKKFFVKRTGRWRFIDQLHFDECYDDLRPFVVIILRKRYAEVQLSMGSLLNYWGVQTSLSASGMNKAYDLLLQERPKGVRKKPIVTNMSCKYDRIPLDRAEYVAEQLYELALDEKVQQDDGEKQGINPKVTLRLIK